MGTVADAMPVQQELIAELKTFKDISVVGLKKLRVERAKEEVQQEQTQAKEFEKQFSSDNFLEKVLSFYKLQFQDFPVFTFNVCGNENNTS